MDGHWIKAPFDFFFFFFLNFYLTNEFWKQLILIAKQCFNLNECDFPPLLSPATRSRPPVKYVGPVRKPIRRVLKSFAEGYEAFRSTVLLTYYVPVSMSHSLLYQPIVTNSSCASPARTTTENFPSHMPSICYITITHKIFQINSSFHVK